MESERKVFAAILPGQKAPASQADSEFFDGSPGAPVSEPVLDAAPVNALAVPADANPLWGPTWNSFEICYGKDNHYRR